MIVAFHPELKIPRLVIFRSYDQNPNALISLTHFQALQYNFLDDPKNFNRTTLKQLEDAAFSFQNRENNTVLAEMFSIELKFTIDCLKFWFQKNHKILELEIDFKMEFKQNNPITNETLCCLCDFPLEPRAKNGWADHVFKAEHLFLENIYRGKQMVSMGIDKFEHFSKKLNQVLDEINSFCASIESESISSNPEIDEIVEKIKKIKTSRDDDNKAIKQKTIAFLYRNSIKFLPTEKIKGNFPVSDKFLSNMVAIAKNRRVIHHSHVTGKILGYAHDFCNQNCKENYYTIPVMTHNQFRLDVFFKKGIRPSVWETSDISTGGRNPTDVNFAIIKNQVRFVNTVKYF